MHKKVDVNGAAQVEILAVDVLNEFLSLRAKRCRGIFGLGVFLLCSIL